jgi:hypothetical protein
LLALTTLGWDESSLSSPFWPAIFSPLTVAIERLQVFPLVLDANISTLNTTEWVAWDPIVWHVGKLEVSKQRDPASDTPSTDNNDYVKDGNTAGSCKNQTDNSLCSLAVRIPSIPGEPIILVF